MQLAEWKGDCIAGVDGGQLWDYGMNKLGVEVFDHEHFRRNCEELGMDCSNLCFYHCDLGAVNIIIDPVTGSLGIIDWETAGYVPKEYIRTKFRFHFGMNLPSDTHDGKVDYRKRVAIKLSEMGFPDVIERWVPWRRS